LGPFWLFKTSYNTSECGYCPLPTTQSMMTMRQVATVSWCWIALGGKTRDNWLWSLFSIDVTVI